MYEEKGGKTITFNQSRICIRVLLHVGYSLNKGSQTKIAKYIYQLERDYGSVLTKLKIKYWKLSAEFEVLKILND